MTRAEDENVRPLTDWATPAKSDATTLTCHGSAVCLSGQGVLILGASGSGKSSLALALMAHGASLVADDAVGITLADEALFVRRPRAALPLIEARHVGLLAADLAGSPVPLRLVVDLDQPEPQRLPPRRKVAWRGATAELIHGAGHPTLWAVLIQHLRGGRVH